MSPAQEISSAPCSVAEKEAILVALRQIVTEHIKQITEQLPRK
jgi:hypothetical protein